MPKKTLDPLKVTELWFDRPGAYGPKKVRYVRISGDPGSPVVLLEFEVPLKGGRPGTATIALPLSMSDAANLLANLQGAQQRGYLPAFAKPKRRTDVN